MGSPLNYPIRIEVRLPLAFDEAGGMMAVPVGSCFYITYRHILFKNNENGPIRMYYIIKEYHTGQNRIGSDFDTMSDMSSIKQCHDYIWTVNW